MVRRFGRRAPCTRSNAPGTRWHNHGPFHVPFTGRARGADSTHEKAPVCPYDPERILVCAARRHPHPARRRWRDHRRRPFPAVPRGRALARLSATRVDDALFEFGAFKWLNRIVPFVVIKFAGAVPGIPGTAAEVADKVLFALIVFLVTMTVSATLSALEHTHRTYQRDQRGQPHLSLKGAMQLVKLVMFITAALVVIGDATGKQIGLLLSGIGAMSAVLMLIFKDTLLGLVAGVQLSSNDMLRIGDWITMPSAGADGTVIDITLNTVKVANFDHTIITVPTWKLITESYQNWRGMTEAGGRRIKRALFVDATSVRFLHDEIERLERLTLLKDYLEDKVDAIEQWNGTLGAAGVRRTAAS